MNQNKGHENKGSGQNEQQDRSSSRRSKQQQQQQGGKQSSQTGMSSGQGSGWRTSRSQQSQ